MMDSARRISICVAEVSKVAELVVTAQLNLRVRQVVKKRDARREFKSDEEVGDTRQRVQDDNNKLGTETCGTSPVLISVGHASL